MIEERYMLCIKIAIVAFIRRVRRCEILDLICRLTEGDAPYLALRLCVPHIHGICCISSIGFLMRRRVTARIKTQKTGFFGFDAQFLLFLLDT
jgi:hypothetical protein